MFLFLKGDRYTEREELKGHRAKALDTEDYRHQGQGDRSSKCGKPSESHPSPGGKPHSTHRRF